MKFDPSALSKPRVISAAAEHTQENQFNPQQQKAKMEEKKAEEQNEMLSANQRPLGPVKAWSFSRLMDFESCPYKVKLSSVDKCPSPSGPAAERGTKIHDHIETFIRGEHAEYTKEIDAFRGLFDRLRDGFSDAKVEVEGDWGFTRDWKVTGWASPDTWARVKLDAIEFESGTSANVFDWKTGRKFGNEMKHAQQSMTYALAAFQRFPDLQFIQTKMIYVDKKEELPGQYTRAQADLLLPRLTLRANKMTTETKFPPTPSSMACKWCPHAKVQEGFEEPACQYHYEA